MQLNLCDSCSGIWSSHNNHVSVNTSTSCVAIAVFMLGNFSLAGVSPSQFHSRADLDIMGVHPDVVGVSAELLFGPCPFRFLLLTLHLCNNLRAETGSLWLIGPCRLLLSVAEGACLLTGPWGGRFPQLGSGPEVLVLQLVAAYVGPPTSPPPKSRSPAGDVGTRAPLRPTPHALG